MPDWLKKITSLITSTPDSATTSADENKATSTPQKFSSTLFENSSQTTKSNPSLSFCEKKPLLTQLIKPISSGANPPKSNQQKEDPKVHQEPEDDNLKALKRLRELPRGTQIESRIAAIKNLLGENEIFKTLKMLRWPQGVVCPRCHSNNVVRRDPPHDAIDKRHHYVCLNCKGDGSPSEFDDFTGLPIGEIRALRQWILCWYLIGFCSVAQIAKVLGISINEVMQIATLGNELTMLPDEKVEIQTKQELQDRKQRMNVDQQEDYTRSASKSPLKPGYKSKK